MNAGVGHVRLDFFGRGGQQIESVGDFGQLAGHELAVGIFAQFAAQLVLQLFAFVIDRQERNGFDIDQTRRHFQKLTGDVHVFQLHLANVFNILIDQLRDHHIVDADLVFADQVQQQIERPLKHFGFILNRFQSFYSLTFP